MDYFYFLSHVRFNESSCTPLCYVYKIKFDFDLIFIQFESN